MTAPIPPPEVPDSSQPLPLPSPSGAPAATTAWSGRLEFTGDGKEYFRIWIVNLLLSLVSLGLYSPWAKVRKAQYYRANTRLEGHVFGYHGDPRAILRGRVVALVLLTAYSWSFQFSKLFGWLNLAALCAVGPWLFMRAQQFAFGNTSYRGLRFGFRADVGDAYRTLLPVLGVWFLPTVLEAFEFDRAVWPSVWLAVLFLAQWPFLHHQLKSYQHGRARFGNHSFSFDSALGRFYTIYLKGLGLNALAFAVAGTLIGIAVALDPQSPVEDFSDKQWLYVILFGIVFYVLISPYYAVYIQRLVWDRTALGEIRFHTDLEALPMFRLTLKNTLLTLLTGGLYWPWAAMALARYRVQCVWIESPHSLMRLTGSVSAERVSATGDGSIDAFGLDIGL